MPVRSLGHTRILVLRARNTDHIASAVHYGCLSCLSVAARHISIRRSKCCARKRWGHSCGKIQDRTRSNELAIVVKQRRFRARGNRALETRLLTRTRLPAPEPSPPGPRSLEDLHRHHESSQSLRFFSHGGHKLHYCLAIRSIEARGDVRPPTELDTRMGIRVSTCRIICPGGPLLWPVCSPPAERKARTHFPAVCDCYFALKNTKTTLKTKAGRLPRSYYIKPPFLPLRRSIPPTVVSTDDYQQRQATSDKRPSRPKMVSTLS
jgi:hypothetical protein